MSTKLTWTPGALPSASPVVMEASAAAPIRLRELDGVDTVDASPIASKGPSQEGDTQLDVTIPPRVITAQGLIQVADYATWWTTRRAIGRAFTNIPVRFGGSLALGMLKLERDGVPTVEIQAMPRSLDVQRSRAPGVGTMDAEWICPYPYFRDIADSRLEVGLAKRVAAASLTASSSSTDANSYATASVTLKAGRLYLLAVTNSKATTPDAAVPTGGATWTSVRTNLFNTAATPTQRVSLFRGIPTVDYTGVVTIGFAGVTQTGAAWSLVELYGVDTATNQGVVQNAGGLTDSGTSVTATLAAFGSAQNGTLGVAAKGSVGLFTPGVGFSELADVNTATPAQALEVAFRNDNDTSVDASWTGAIAASNIGAELKALSGTAINAGDVDAPILAKLWGPAATVTLTNLTTGELFTVTVALTAAEYLEVDTTLGVKSLTKVSGGTRTNAMSGLSLVNARLWNLRPGNNSVQYDATGSGPETHAEVTWRNRYSGI